MAAILHPGNPSSESRRNFPDVVASIVHTPIDEDEFMARKNATLADSDQIKDQVFSELQSLIEESEKLLNDSAALVGEEAETLRAQVSLKLRQARQAASNVRNKAQPVVDATQDYIGGHPWQTVAISAGLGLVVGLLLGRRN
ncbi:MAG: DUF883 family protein [Pseudomonas alloputida]|uniref:DUF883 family protein n=2 Tax=Pseudomonas putida TaxID=303 RepID=A0AAW5HIY2_PSEPU|nr:DUF883 family protein [Pseudomonas putida]MCO1620858.1 DUF883 family protein [Pseudomonas putida]